MENTHADAHNYGKYSKGLNFCTTPGSKNFEPPIAFEPFAFCVRLNSLAVPFRAHSILCTDGRIGPRAVRPDGSGVGGWKPSHSANSTQLRGESRAGDERRAAVLLVWSRVYRLNANLPMVRAHAAQNCLVCGDVMSSFARNSMASNTTQKTKNF